MAITYYQEFVPDDYLARVELWHREFAWHQCVSKDGKVKWLVSAPAVHSIWDAIYGATISDPLKKSTVERVLPCIIEAKPFPADLVNLAVRRASNRNAYKSDEWRLWEKNLGIACALYKGYCKRRFNQEHSMALDTSNHSRDYLYGRLLAIAEHIEDRALDLADEKRSTAAARLMQVFADRPYSTWRNIELALQPYSQRLKAKRSGFLHNMNSLIDEVTCMFEAEAFTQDKPLSGEFLLGFHCQRLELRSSRDEEQQSNSTSTGEEQ